jgi:hypothetical protein
MKKRSISTLLRFISGLYPFLDFRREGDSRVPNPLRSISLALLKSK